MPILGIGIDIVHLPRIRAMLLKNHTRFLSRILTQHELKDMDALQKSTNSEIDQDVIVNFVGARWSVKEACYKAAFPTKLTWQDVNLVKKDGKPYLYIPEKERFGIKSSFVSISHDGEYLVGSVLFESTKPDSPSLSKSDCPF